MTFIAPKCSFTAVDFIFGLVWSGLSAVVPMTSRHATSGYNTAVCSAMTKRKWVANLTVPWWGWKIHDTLREYSRLCMRSFALGSRYCLFYSRCVFNLFFSFLPVGLICATASAYVMPRAASSTQSQDVILGFQPKHQPRNDFLGVENGDASCQCSGDGHVRRSTAPNAHVARLFLQ